MFVPLQLFCIFPLITKESCALQTMLKASVVCKSKMMEAQRKPLGQRRQIEQLLLQCLEDLCCSIWHVHQAFVQASCILSSDA